MNNYNDKTEIAAQKLKKAGLKITPQRIAILRELTDNYNHPTADAVYQKIKLKLSNISFDTVNRTLIAFAQSGLIKTTESQGGARRYDPETEPHHHFHCITCDKIIDFINKEYDNVKLPKDITKKHTVSGRKIVLDGICQDCKNKNNRRV